MPVVSDYTALLGILQSPTASWNAHYGTGAPVFVTYSFTETQDLPVDDSEDLGPHADRKVFEAYSEAFKETFRDALKAISAASGVTFVEVTGRAMINAYGIRNTGEDSYAHFADSRDYLTSSGDLVMGLDGNPPGADRTRQLIWHEMCHALGLKHPFEGENTLPIELDNTNHTVMSYNYLVDAVLQLGHLDIDALRYLYGNPNNKTGWNWSYDAGTFTVTGAARSDIIIGVLGQNNLYGGRGNDTLAGRENADILSGGIGADKAFGFAGDDVLSGGIGKDTLDGGSGDDRIYGGYGADILSGGDGADTIAGGFGGDSINGGSGDDKISGGYNRDTLFGDDGNDALSGNDGIDYLVGGDGNDSLYGGWSSDLLEGGRGNDRLFGGAGKDTLVGGFGADTLVGGAGADVFVFSQSDFLDVTDGEFNFDVEQVNVITDFEDGIDRIQMASDLGYSFDGATLTQVGTSVLVDFNFGTGVKILLRNMTVSQIDASDFLFDL